MVVAVVIDGLCAHTSDFEYRACRYLFIIVFVLFLEGGQMLMFL